MSRKSQKIRASRREKMAMRWPEMRKPESGRIRSGLVRSSRADVECFAGDPSLPVGVAPGSLPLPE